MTLFDPRAALQKIENAGGDPATFATFGGVWGCKVAKVAEVAASRGQIAKNEPPAIEGSPTDCKHGFAIGGRLKTWTGKVASLEEWRRLSEWEKRGPDGRHWNGMTKQWEVPE